MLCRRRGRRVSANSDLLGNDMLCDTDMLAASVSLAIIYARCVGDDEVSYGALRLVAARSAMRSQQMYLLFALPGCSWRDRIDQTLAFSI